MRQFSYTLTLDESLHSRHMGRLRKEASRFSSHVRLKNGIDEAALEDLRTGAELRMQRGSCITVSAEGVDEEAAIAAIQTYFVANM